MEPGAGFQDFVEDSAGRAAGGRALRTRR
jgi:hypothetical protein